MNIRFVSLQDIYEKLSDELSEITDEIDAFIETITLEDDRAEEKYNEWLDEIYGPVKLGDSEWEASYVLEMLDPVGYRVGFNDWIGDMDEDDLKMFKEYRDLLEKKEELIEEIQEIEVAIEEAETDEAMQEDDE